MAVYNLTSGGRGGGGGGERTNKSVSNVSIVQLKEHGTVINKPKLINIGALQEVKDVPPQVADPKDKIIFTTNFHHVWQ